MPCKRHVLCTCDVKAFAGNEGFKAGVVYSAAYISAAWENPKYRGMPIQDALAAIGRDLLELKEEPRD